MSQEHIIYYTLATFWPRHNCLKSDMLAPLGDATTRSQNNRKLHFTNDTKTDHHVKKGSKKAPKWDSYFSRNRTKML